MQKKFLFYFMILGFLSISLGVGHAGNYKTIEKEMNKSSKKINKTFFKEIYSLDEAQAVEFFTKYFDENKLDRALMVNLAYPVFHWRSNHLNLQRALVYVFTKELDTYFSQPVIKTKDLLQDTDLLKHYFYMMGFLSYIPRFSKEMDVIEQHQLGVNIIDNMSSWPIFKYLMKNKTKDDMNIFYIQAVLLAVSYGEKCADDEIWRPLLKLKGKRAALWKKHGIVLLDNFLFEDVNIDAMSDYIAKIPTRFKWTRVVMCESNYLLKSTSKIGVKRFQSSINVFNVFSRTVGSGSGNQFPKDYPIVKTDRFMSVFIHELNHGIDTLYIKKDKTLKARKQALIADAGVNHYNYLRSMFKDGFFVKAPQEFFASMSNMYFCSSEHAFKYALQKAKIGNYKPLDQFLFKALMYTEDGMCYFYRVSEKGKVLRESIAVTLKDNYITSLTYQGKKYNFILKDGFIKKVIIQK